MKDDFQIMIVNIINLFKFNSVESIIKFILFVFLIVVASIVIHLVCKFISLSIKKKETDQDIKKKTEYYKGYIQGAIDRKTEECNNDGIFNGINQANESLADNRLAYLQGYIDGHKDDKFWK